MDTKEMEQNKDVQKGTQTNSLGKKANYYYCSLMVDDSLLFTYAVGLSPLLHIFVLLHHTFLFMSCW